MIGVSTTVTTVSALQRALHEKGVRSTPATPFLLAACAPSGKPIRMHCRWMNEDDIPELSALAQRIWYAHYPDNIITRAQTEYMLEKSYSTESIRAQLNAGHQFLLALGAGKIIGFLSVGPLSDVKDPILRGTTVMQHDRFLHKFYAAPEQQGKGLGKALLQELLIRLPNMKRLRLQVARKNTNSWNFYLKRGFTIEREADFDIGNGFVMADYVMEKILT